MAQSKEAITLRLSAAQLRSLKLLEKKLGLDRTNVIRLAITRLAEAENVVVGAEAPRR